MKRIAVFPGSFDPITKGHEEIIRRASVLFDEVIVAIGRNTSKSYLFPEDQRVNWVKQTFADTLNVAVQPFDGLTIDFCRNNNAQFIVRGVRNSADFEYEMAIAQMNRAMAPQLETVIMLSDPRFTALSSTIIREIIKNKGPVSQFLPDKVQVYA